ACRVLSRRYSGLYERGLFGDLSPFSQESPFPGAAPDSAPRVSVLQAFERGRSAAERDPRSRRKAHSRKGFARGPGHAACDAGSGGGGGGGAGGCVGVSGGSRRGRGLSLL